MGSGGIIANIQQFARRGLFARYSTATPSRTRKLPTSDGDADTVVTQAGTMLYRQARHLEENHDLVRGVLDTLVNNTVGPEGIQVEPQPQTTTGSIHEEFAKQLLAVYKDWSARPEVTWEMGRPAMERFMARSLYRDGEVFGQHVIGRTRTINHGTLIPYSVELLECDMVPRNVADGITNNVFSGVVKNAWGRPVAYKVYKDHPGAMHGTSGQLKEVSADIMLHAKLATRIGQTRGVTALAPVLSRLHDLKDYEESERISARISAAIAYYVRKGNPDLYQPEDDDEDEDSEPRQFDLAPGTVFDNLGPGEEIGDVHSSRPSQLLQPFRNSMLKAVASGTQTSYSTIARDYSGTWSAQRQELVEQFINYRTMQRNFTTSVTQPMWENVVSIAIATNQVKVPRDVDPLTVADAEFYGPVMPWIDPAKEATANVTLVRAGMKSLSQVIRERGQNPQSVMAEIERERAEAAEKGLDFTSFSKDTGDTNNAPDEDGSEDQGLRTQGTGNK